MTPIEALQNAIQECVEVDRHGELSFKAGDVSNFIKASGFIMTQEKSKLSKAIDDAIIHAFSESDGITLLSKHFIEHFKESGFKLVSTVPSDADVKRVAITIADKIILSFDEEDSQTAYFVSKSRAAIAAYVGGE